MVLRVRVGLGVDGVVVARIGVVNDEWYILLNEDGQTGYLPQAWLWPGNG